MANMRFKSSFLFLMESSILKISGSVDFCIGSIGFTNVNILTVCASKGSSLNRWLGSIAYSDVRKKNS